MVAHSINSQSDIVNKPCVYIETHINFVDQWKLQHSSNDTRFLFENKLLEEGAFVDTDELEKVGQNNLYNPQ